MATNGVSKANGAPSSNAAKYNLPSHFIGGNHLGVAPQSKVKDFVQASGGHTVITNVCCACTSQLTLFLGEGADTNCAGVCRS